MDYSEKLKDRIDELEGREYGKSSINYLKDAYSRLSEITRSENMTDEEYKKIPGVSGFDAKEIAKLKEEKIEKKQSTIKGNIDKLKDTVAVNNLVRELFKINKYVMKAGVDWNKPMNVKIHEANNKIAIERDFEILADCQGINIDRIIMNINNVEDLDKINKVIEISNEEIQKMEETDHPSKYEKPKEIDIVREVCRINGIEIDEGLEDIFKREVKDHKDSMDDMLITEGNKTDIKIDAILPLKVRKGQLEEKISNFNSNPPYGIDMDKAKDVNYMNQMQQLKRFFESKQAEPQGYKNIIMTDIELIEAEKDLNLLMSIASFSPQMNEKENKTFAETLSSGVVSDQEYIVEQKTLDSEIPNELKEME